MKKLFIFLLVSLSMVSLSSAALIDDILAYYELDETSGIVIDQQGIYNGINVGGTPGEIGIINNSYKFTGAGNYINLTGLSLNSSSQYTVSMWLNSSDVSRNQFLEFINPRLTFDVEADGNLRIYDTEYRDWASATFIDGGWNMYTYTFDENANTCELYINGVSKGNVTYVTNSPSGEVSLGANTAHNYYFNGAIDEVGMWDRILPEEEILTLYGGGNPPSYPFGEEQVTVDLYLPSNNSLTSLTDINFTANLTSDASNFTNATYFIWYDNDTIFNQTTVSLPNTNNTTYTLLVTDFLFENYKWNVYACISSGDCSFADENYTLRVSPFSIDGVSYNESVLETSSQTFMINITAISTVSSVTGFFWYNGSSYTALITNPSNGEYSATSTLDIPLQNNVGNKSFHWQFDFTLTGSPDTQQNTSEYSHEVNRTFIELCNSTYSSNIINFTTRNSENPFPKLNATFKSAWQWWIGSGSVMRNRSYEDVNENLSDFDFCGLADNINYIFNVDIEADATEFAKNFYYFTDAPITSGDESGTDIYLLNDSLATPTTLLVRDRYQRVKEDVLIYVQLYDVGTDSFYTVTMGKTNQNGEDIVYLNWYDSLYKFLLVENGTTVLTTDAYKVGETPQIFQIEEDIVYDLDKFDDFEYLLTFDNTTNNFVLTYVKPNGLVESGCLRVFLRESLGDTEICEVCSTSVSATLYCDISNAGNGTFIATFYATGSLSVIDWITEEVGIGISETIYLLLDKDDSAFYSILTSIIVLGVFLINPVFGIIAIIGGLLLASVLGFALISYLTFLFITCVGGIIIWILRR